MSKLRIHRQLNFLLLILVFILGCGRAPGRIRYTKRETASRIPNKIIAAWNGNREELILALKPAGDLLNEKGLWIIPIQSASVPQIVSLDDDSVFNDIITYLYDENMDNKDDPGTEVPDDQGKPDAYHGPSFVFEESDAADPHFTVLSSKEMDLYDVTVIKTNSATLLREWLEDQSYPVRADLKEIFSSYARWKDVYFVILKIDVANKFPAEIKLIRAALNELELNWQKAREELTALSAENEAYCGFALDEEYPEKYGMSIFFEAFARCAYEQLKKEFNAEGEVVDQATEAMPSRPLLYKIHLNSGWELVFVRADVRVRLLYNNKEVLDIKYDRISQQDKFIPYIVRRSDGQIAYQPAEDVLNTAKEIYAPRVDAVVDRINNFYDSSEELYKRKREMRKYHKMLADRPIRFLLYQAKYRGRRWQYYEKYLGEKFAELTNRKADLAELENTANLPIKISFQPEISYFPLRSLNLSESDGRFDLYVLTDVPVMDTCGNMHTLLIKEIKPSLIDQLRGKVLLDRAKFVTRLSWDGTLHTPPGDVVFEGEGDSPKGQPPSPREKTPFLLDFPARRPF